MSYSVWMLLISGGFILTGITYPSYARWQPGWKVGAWAEGPYWALWFGMGAPAYFGGMASIFGWLGLLGAIPLASLVGLALTITAGRHVQMLALAGPVLANLWFVT